MNELNLGAGGLQIYPAFTVPPYYTTTTFVPNQVYTPSPSPVLPVMNPSDIWYCVDNNLSGYTTFANQPLIFISPPNTLEPQGIIQCYVQLAASVSAKYNGSLTNQSGYFGSSFHLKPATCALPDTDSVVFDYLDNCQFALNNVFVEDEINVAYVPPDTSFMTFKKPSTDPYSGGNGVTPAGYSSTQPNSVVPGVNTINSPPSVGVSHRMDIYGRGISSSSQNSNNTSSNINNFPITVTMCKVYAILPTVNYAEIIPTRMYNSFMSTSDLESMNNITKNHGMLTYSKKDEQTIQDFHNLPVFMQQNLVDKNFSGLNRSQKKEAVDQVKGVSHAIQLPENVIPAFG
jgi:hypothetical protein